MLLPPRKSIKFTSCVFEFLRPITLYNCAVRLGLDSLVHFSQATPHILVVQPRHAACMKISADLRRVYPKAKIVHASDLSEAYNLSEHAHPDLVLLDESHANASGLPMFFSLLAALSVEWFILSDGTKIGCIPQNHQIDRHKLTVDLASVWSLRTSRRANADDIMSPHVSAPAFDPGTGWKAVVIGASTGGIEALIEVLSRFPANAPPTLIVQHIKPSFLRGLARRLDRICAATVRAANDDNQLKSGLILMAPGDQEHLLVTHRGRRCKLKAGPPMNGHRPSVDALFCSAAQQLGPDCVGVLLSGMGCD
ncbi:MAG: chemotaxis protein CheB, partial [Pseudomonadota bacterium]